MPPLRTYIFRHKISSNINITIETWRNKEGAYEILRNYVINVNDWVL